MVDRDEVEAEIERRKETEYDSISSYLEKQERIKKEIRRLNNQFKEISKNKKNLVKTTIADIAFMAVTMEDLRDSIIRDGTTTDYKNGENQYGKKQSPDAQLYLQMSQKHTQAMKILLDCLPKTPQNAGVKDDGFDDFVNNREDV